MDEQTLLKLAGEYRHEHWGQKTVKAGLEAATWDVDPYGVLDGSEDAAEYAADYLSLGSRPDEDDAHPGAAWNSRDAYMALSAFERAIEQARLTKGLVESEA
jgi:hypothetical protein